MPRGSQHTDHCLERYGVGGEDIHNWMDEPSRIAGNHRRFRHNPNQEIPKSFIDKYGEQLARNIILDHILLDRQHNEESYTKEKEREQELEYNVKYALNSLFTDNPYKYGTEDYWALELYKNTNKEADSQFNKWLNKWGKDKEIAYWNAWDVNPRDIEMKNINSEEVKEILNRKIKKYLKENNIRIYSYNPDTKTRTYYI